MKKILLTSILSVLMLVPSVAIAGNIASRTKTARGANHLMCGLNTATACDDNTRSPVVTDIYAVVDQYDSVTFTYSENGTGSCDIYAAGPEVDVPGTSDLSTLSVVKVNDTSLTISTPQITLSGFDFKYMWVECSIVGTDTTVYMHGTFGTQKW